MLSVLPDMLDCSCSFRPCVFRSDAVCNLAQSRWTHVVTARSSVWSMSQCHQPWGIGTIALCCTGEPMEHTAACKATSVRASQCCSCHGNRGFCSRGNQLGLSQEQSESSWRKSRMVPCCRAWSCLVLLPAAGLWCSRALRATLAALLLLLPGAASAEVHAGVGAGVQVYLGSAPLLQVVLCWPGNRFSAGF